MKFKKVKQKSDGARLLKVILDKKNDTFNYVVAMRLSANEIEGLLPFSFPKESVLPDLFYDITDLVTLKTYMETKQSLNQFKAMIEQVVDLLEILTPNNMPLRNLVLNFDDVYVDVNNDAVLFIYLPLDSQPVKDSAALELLLKMSQAVEFVVDSDKNYADELIDFIKRQSVFSLIDLERFLGYRASSEINTFRAGDIPSERLGGTIVAGDSVQTSKTAHSNAGRDFVTELSGVQNFEQQFVSQSVAKNILSAISEDLQPATASEELNGDARTVASAKTDIAKPLVRHVESATFALIRISDKVSWRLEGKSATIGRSKTAQYQVSESTTVSRIHALIEVEDGQLYLTDNKSSNGTFVNGNKLLSGQKIQVERGDRITLGDQEFKVE